MILNRNIILFAISAVFILLTSLMHSYLYEDKYKLIKKLETEQKEANEKYITAQILSEKLNSVYNLFESNLASKSSDPKNKEANMLFLKDLTDIIEKLDMKLLFVEPGGKIKRGLLTYIPYSMEIKCSFEELGKLITQLEANDRLITIDELNIRNGLERINQNTKNAEEVNSFKVFLSINTVTLNKSKS
tara:strand:+ start:1451 stop:2017 length:567 start_codon:yes stop_codon:yes gene_type:complete